MRFGFGLGWGLGIGLGLGGFGYWFGFGYMFGFMFGIRFGFGFLWFCVRLILDLVWFGLEVCWVIWFVLRFVLIWFGSNLGLRFGFVLGLGWICWLDWSLDLALGLDSYVCVWV